MFISNKTAILGKAPMTNKIEVHVNLRFPQYPRSPAYSSARLPQFAEAENNNGCNKYITQATKQYTSV